MFQFFHDLLHDKETFEKHLGVICTMLIFGTIIFAFLFIILFGLIKKGVF